MPLIRRAAAFWLLLTVPALSGQLEPTDMPMLDTCLEKGQGTDCIGLITTPCLAEPGGETTIGAQRCFKRGLAAWEVVLTRQYSRLLARTEAIDTAHSSSAGESAVNTLRVAQHAWTVFRDADCRHRYTVHGHGSLRGVAHAACLRDLTAARALAFRGRLTEGE